MFLISEIEQKIRQKLCFATALFIKIGSKILATERNNPLFQTISYQGFRFQFLSPHSTKASVIKYWG